MKDVEFKNAVGDWFISDKKRELQNRELDLEQSKLDLFKDIANKPAKSNNMLLIIPVAVLLIGGTIAIIMLKKKK